MLNSTNSLAFLGFAVFLLLVVGTLRSIGRNLAQRSFDQVRPWSITFLGIIEFVLIGLMLLLIWFALPHPLVPVLLVLGCVVVVIDRELRYQEESRSLNRWIRLGVRTGAPVPDLAQRFAESCRSRVGPRSKAFAFRLTNGMVIEKAARKSGLQIDADTMASIAIQAGSEQLDADGVADRMPYSPPSSHRHADIDRRERESSRVLQIPFEQFFYVVCVIVLARVLGQIVQAMMVTLFRDLQIATSDNPWSRVSHEATWYLNVVVYGLAIWLALSLMIRFLPGGLVRWVPWFGPRKIAKWRTEILSWLQRETKLQRPVDEVFLYGWKSNCVRWIRRRCKIAYNVLQNGMALPLAMRKSGLVSKREQIWLTNAERNGNLSGAMGSLIDDIIRRENNRWRIRMSWFVPLVTVMVGAYVLVQAVFLFYTLADLIVRAAHQ